MGNKIDDKTKDLSPKELELLKIRHSAEHVLMHAIQNLGLKHHKAMGPATNDGFYFDFEMIEGSITDNDFPAIEKEMARIIKTDLPITRINVTKDQALEMFAYNPYKTEWINEASQRGENLSVYWTGEPNSSNSFVDLCAGPHVSHTGEIGAFKLLSVAGAYWRGDEKNKMLTRIYGTAFPTDAELNDYLYLLEESKKRDHKVLGVNLDLFTFSNLVGAGLPLWTPKGTLLRTTLDDFVWELRKEKGYQKVEIPHITKKDLYETSGHWAKFSNELFHINTREGHEFVMKPMNCPHHTQIFGRYPHSYRDMPQRYANTTMVYRDEQSGELSGLSRVRSITQDDAHVFCREFQVENEVLAIWQIVDKFYQATGFSNLKIRLSLHDPNEMEKYLGTESDWKHAEDQLRLVLNNNHAEFYEKKGEAAFYGPKIDFMTNDSLGREWQVATIQLDRNMPERFDLHCINENGAKERVVMIHAAIMGSIERFTSVLIEHFAGAFPLWLAPVQVVVIPISEKNSDYALNVHEQLMHAGVRVEIENKNETMGNKIRKAQEQKIPYMLVVGKLEEANQTANIRLRTGETRGELPLSEFIDDITTKIKTRSLDI